MKSYCGLYESSLKCKDKFSNCRVFSFMAIDYFQKHNIKSAYMQIGTHTFSNDVHDLVIYEGKNNDWFVADLSMFFSLYYCRFIKQIRNDFESRYGFKSDKDILQFPLRDYIDKYAKNFDNRIFATFLLQRTVETAIIVDVE